MTNLEGYFFDAIEGSNVGFINFRIENNQALNQIEGSPEIIRLNLTVLNNLNIKKVYGFENTRQIGRGSIGGGTHIEYIGGFNNLEIIGFEPYSDDGWFSIGGWGTGELAQIDSIGEFPRLKEIWGDLNFIDCAGFTKLPDFDSLRIINNELRLRNVGIMEFKSFQHLDSLNKLISLKNLFALDSIFLPSSLKSIGIYDTLTPFKHTIFLQDMPNLAYWGGLETITFAGAEIYLENLPLLTTAPALCNIISSPGGLPPDVTLQDNAEPFNSIEGIEIHCDELLPVETAETLEKVKLYPNPVYDWLRIENGEDVRQLKIVNMAGQVVYEARKWNGNGVDLSRLPTGVYLVQLYDGEGNHVSHRMIKAGQA